jgi:hypothetical protein
MEGTAPCARPAAPPKLGVAGQGKEVAGGNEIVGRSDEDGDEIDEGEETLPGDREVELFTRARAAPLPGDVAVGESDCAWRTRFCNRALGELFVIFRGMAVVVVVTAVVFGWTIRVVTDAGCLAIVPTLRGEREITGELFINGGEAGVSVPGSFDVLGLEGNVTESSVAGARPLATPKPDGATEGREAAESSEVVG